MRTKKPRSRNVPNPVARGFPSCYEPSFKRSVIMYAEQKNNQEARKRYGIAEETIRRWRKQKKEIMGQAEQSIRRSQRRTVGQGGFADAPHSLQTRSVKELEEDPSTPDLDSMPLQQRLSQNHESIPTQVHQESVLQSLPISPTKLKVTRQGKPLAPPPTPPQRAPAQEVCLKWNSHHINMQSAFPTLLNRGQYVDATLVAEGRTLKCHKMILSSCSPYFEEVLNGIGPLEHPVLFMNSPYWVLESLCAFMYAGEVHIMQDQLTDLLNAASSLKIKGLANSSTNGEPDMPNAPQVKQETRSLSPGTASEKTVKEEKEEESKPVKYDMKSSKKKEDRKAKQSSQQKFPETPPLKMAPKFPDSSKTTVRNVMKGIAKSQPKPLTTRGGQLSRRSESTKRSDKYKLEAAGQKDKDKEKPSLRKGNINDPLDLLQPVYEEIAKVAPRSTPAIVRNAAIGKSREKGGVSVRRAVNKRMKKRKYDLIEDREESPPPDFPARKGTRSRPQVKIPKFFHSHFEDSAKDTTDATIVREPHTDQSDPLIGVEVEEIKAEPLDVDENALEVEEGNLVNYMVQDHEMNQEGEEIIGNYDSPLVNIKREPTTKSSISNPFKKAVHPSPVIVDVHTVAEADGGLMTIKKEKVELVDISKINSSVEEETIIGTSGFDSDSALSKTTQIIISHVQSMAEEDRSKEGDMPVEAAQPHMSQLGNHSSVTDALVAEPSSLLPCEPDPLAQTGDQQLQTEEDSALVNDKPEENLADTESTSIENGSAETELKAPEILAIKNATSKAGAIEQAQQQHDDEARTEADPSESDVEKNSLVVPATSNDQHATHDVGSGGSSSWGSLAGKLGMVNLSQSSNDRMSTDTTDDSVLDQDESILKEPDTSHGQADEFVEQQREAEATEEVCPPEEVPTVPFEKRHVSSGLEDSVIIAEATEESGSSTMKVAERLGAEQTDLTLEPLEEWSSHETPVEPMATSQGSAEPVYTEHFQGSFQQLQTDESRELTGHNINCRASVDEAASSKDLFAPVAEKIDKIEAELEECLASTSDMVPVQPLLAKSVPFDDNEDFTRDIEFSSFINKSNYLDYDFVADVEMEVKDDCRVEAKKGQDIDMTEPQIVRSERDYDEFTTNVQADEGEPKDDIFQDREIGDLGTGLEFEHNNQLGNNQDFPGCAEDAQQFLAGLDDDIIMDSVGSSQQQMDASPEKTLEMIVNDLNESLGE